MSRRRLVPLALVVALLPMASCARSYSASSAGSTADMSPTPPTPDPRVGLRAGWFDAGQAIWNLELVSTTRPSEQFLNLSTPGDARLTNSDLAFLGNYVFQGNYSGWQVWDISDPRKPVLRTAYVCPGSQSDVTVYRNLLFVSAEATSGRVDCGLQGVQDTVSNERARGIRIIDISDITKPRYITTVQTCRGSHTNTLVTDPKDPENVYIYVSGSAGVRSPNELPGCSGAPLEQDPNTALFRIEVIRVPLANPERAAIVSSPRIFGGLEAPPRHGDTPADIAAAEARARAAGRERRRPTGPRTGPTQCHDITVYPAIGLAGGACAGYGFLLDISDVANPKRIAAVADSNFSFWHSATFSNDGSKVLFTDEWGGGSQPRCRATDKPEWGANAIFTIVDEAGSPILVKQGAPLSRTPTLKFQSYFKIPAAQTPYENCVAHNGSLIPVPGRDIMVQAWYQGGISVFDWTDPANPKEIAYFDRGPMDATKLVQGGHWSTYWYNGYIVSSEIARGLDILQLKPSAFLTQNEIDAARLVRFDHFNAQEQPKLVWPAAFVVARAYLDQLVRGNGLPRARTSAIARDLAAAENLTGDARRTALTQLAAQLDADAQGSTDRARVRAMAEVVRELAR
jgi:hypothetical protein